MSDPTHPSRPTAPSPTGGAPPAASTSTSMRDRLGEAARVRAKRPTQIRILYAALAVFAVVYAAGVMAGWWGSPVADKVRARRELDAQEKSKPAPVPAPAAPSMSPDTPVPPR